MKKLLFNLTSFGEEEKKINVQEEEKINVENGTAIRRSRKYSNLPNPPVYAKTNLGCTR